MFVAVPTLFVVFTQYAVAPLTAVQPQVMLVSVLLWLPAVGGPGGTQPPAQGVKAIQLLPSQNSKQPVVVLNINKEVAGLGIAFRSAVVILGIK
jgi:hypothetical protein